MIAEAITHVVFVAAALVYTSGRADRSGRGGASRLLLRSRNSGVSNLRPIRALARRIGSAL